MNWPTYISRSWMSEACYLSVLFRCSELQKTPLLISQSLQPDLGCPTLISSISFKPETLSNTYPHFLNHPPGSLLIDSLLTQESSQRHSVSVISSLIVSPDSARMAHPKRTREEEIGVLIPDSQWTLIFHPPYISWFISMWVFFLKYTNAWLAKIYPTASNSCNRCQQSSTNHTHMFWSCPSLSNFWSQIFDTLATVLNVELSLDPSSAQFGIPPLKLTNIPSIKCSVLSFTALLPRCLNRLITAGSGKFWLTSNLKKLDTLLQVLARHLIRFGNPS